MPRISLLARSSFSHDLSNFLYLRNSPPCRKTIFIILSFSSNKIFNEKRYYLQDYKNLLSSHFVLSVRLSSYVSRLILLLFVLAPLFFLWALKIIELFLIQPSPSWLYQRFGPFSLIIPQLPSFLVGDGVGSETLASTPFWLSHVYKSSRSALVQSSSYAFSLEDNSFPHGFPRSRYPSSLLSQTFDDSLRQLVSDQLPSLLRSLVDPSIRQSFFILVTSTFSEYRRIPLEKEMDLYQLFLANLSESFPPGFQPFIIIKPHPMTSSAKMNCLVRLEDKIFCNSHQSREEILHRLYSLMPIPLETLVTYLLSLQSCADVTLVSASAASLPSVLAYPQLKHILLFGSLLSKEAFFDISKYNDRVLQESKIRNLLSKIS